MIIQRGVTSVWGNFILSTATETTPASDVTVTLMRTMMMNSTVQFRALFTTSLTDSFLFLLPSYFYFFHQFGEVRTDLAPFCRWPRSRVGSWCPRRPSVLCRRAGPGVRGSPVQILWWRCCSLSSRLDPRCRRWDERQREFIHSIIMQVKYQANEPVSLAGFIQWFFFILWYRVEFGSGLWNLSKAGAPLIFFILPTVQTLL